MIVIIDGIGANLFSIVCAVKRLGFCYEISDDPKVIQKASHVILPGVGSSDRAMNFLNSKGLIEVIQNLTQPVLGICLGMQLLFNRSEEGQKPLLSIIPGEVKRFRLPGDYSIPHMGWNVLDYSKSESPLFANLPKSLFAYFVHSFYVPVQSYCLASCNYGIDFAAVVQYKNFYGMQFHPERSATEGERLLFNFLKIE